MDYHFGGLLSESRDAVHFKVWAPKANDIKLFLYNPTILYSATSDFTPSDSNGKWLQMSKSKENPAIWELKTTEAKIGSLYKYKVDNNGPFPDPASRFQPYGVHGPSQLVDHSNFQWTDDSWTSKHQRKDRQSDVESLIFYELHIGTFTKEGTYRSAEEKLSYLKELGITAIEVLPLADFPGQRNWGYDGVSLYAPARCYGTPDDFRHFVNAAHKLGLFVILDLVYNHLGPDGNYLGCYSPYYFTEKHSTPWGPALNIDLSLSSDNDKEINQIKKDKDPEEIDHVIQVRRFLLENAMHWVHEYHVDGFRMDATHALVDNSTPHFLQELTEKCNSNNFGKNIIFFAEDDRNTTKMIKKPPNGYGFDGCWADDFHHQVRVKLAGDHESYFENFTGSTEDLATTIKKGWFYCGQMCGDRLRGTDPTEIQNMSSFCYCIQNHDQVGNRAMGDRLNHKIDITSYKAATALLLTTPAAPLLFQGQEWAASTPFCFFTDHNPELGKLVTEGRRKEFAKFSAFNDPELREKIPDPQAESTYKSSCLNFEEITKEPHASMLRYYKALLQLRNSEPALQTSRRDHFEILAIPEEESVAILRKSINPEDPSIIALINLKGTSSIEFNRVSEKIHTPHWEQLEVLFTSEDPPFGTTKLPDVRIDDRVVNFAVPGAVILRASAARK